MIKLLDKLFLKSATSHKDAPGVSISAKRHFRIEPMKTSVEKQDPETTHKIDADGKHYNKITVSGRSVWVLDILKGCNNLLEFNQRYPDEAIHAY